MSTSVIAPTLSAEEVSRAATYLKSTRDDLVRAVKDLPFEQYSFKPAPDRWSIAQILEHVAIIEQRVGDRIRALPEGAVAEHGRKDAEIDAFVLAEVTNRTVKVQAPPTIEPSGNWDLAESLARFTEGRDRTLTLLSSAPCLRGTVVSHPMLGALDGYQWLLAVGAHTARHLAQIKEVMARPEFPRHSGPHANGTAPQP